MIQRHLHTLFWDTNLDTFTPEAYPDYTIFRILDVGDDAAVSWLRQTFREEEIRRVLSTERRLSEKSANFWALVYRVPSREVGALSSSRYPKSD